MADLPLTPLDCYLSAHLPGYQGPLHAEKFASGQSNPTYLLVAASGRYVLRGKPAGNLLKSAHAVDREFRVQSALAGTDVPVARMRVLCEDPSVIGTMFYIMDFVEGRHFAHPRLALIGRQDRRPVLAEMNRVLAAIHNVDLVSAGLGDYGRPGNYFERQLTRWSGQYQASQTGPLDGMFELIDELGRRRPQDDGQTTLVHGDFRIDNLLFDKATPTCVAVLDWELSTLGHPYADLATVIMQWRMPADPAGRGLAGVDRAAEGLMSDQDFVDLYCARRGLSGIDDFGFYVAFAFFRMAAILQGVKKRALDGNASNLDQAMELAQQIPRLVANGLEVLAVNS